MCRGGITSAGGKLDIPQAVPWKPGEQLQAIVPGGVLATHVPCPEQVFWAHCVSQVFDWP
jgi:hypothetical protein